MAKRKDPEPTPEPEEVQEQETEATEAEEVVEEEAPEETSEEWRKRFTSEEDMWKSYREAEKKLNEQAQDFATVRKAAEKLAPFFSEEKPQEIGQGLRPDQPVPPEQEQALNLLGQFIEEYAQRGVSRALDPYMAQRDYEKIIGQHPDLPEFADSIAQELAKADEKAPGVFRDYLRKNPEHLVTLYKAAKAEKAKEQGKQEAYESQRKKKEARVESASYATTKAGGSPTKEDLAKMGSQEWEKTRDTIFKLLEEHGGVLPEE